MRLTGNTAWINFTVASPTTIALLGKKWSELQQKFSFWVSCIIGIIEDWPHMTSSSTWIPAHRLNGAIHQLPFAKVTYKSVNMKWYLQNINISIWWTASQGLFVFPSLNLSFVCIFFITVVMNIVSEANWLLDGAESWTHPRHWGLVNSVRISHIWHTLISEITGCVWTLNHHDNE